MKIVSVSKYFCVPLFLCFSSLSSHHSSLSFCILWFITIFVPLLSLSQTILVHVCLQTCMNVCVDMCANVSGSIEGSYVL